MLSQGDPLQRFAALHHERVYVFGGNSPPPSYDFSVKLVRVDFNISYAGYPEALQADGGLESVSTFCGDPIQKQVGDPDVFSQTGDILDNRSSVAAWISEGSTTLHTYLATSPIAKSDRDVCSKIRPSPSELISRFFITPLVTLVIPSGSLHALLRDSQ